MSFAPVFSAETRAAFAELYPTQAGKLRHSLGEHLLLSLEALARLAETLPADSV